MPVRVTLAPGRFTRIQPTEAWQTTAVSLPSAADFQVDPNFYVLARAVEK